MDKVHDDAPPDTAEVNFGRLSEPHVPPQWSVGMKHCGRVWTTRQPLIRKNNKIMVNYLHIPEATGIYEKTGGENTPLPLFTVRNFIFLGGFFRLLMVIVKNIFQHQDIQLPDFQSEEDAVNHLERLFKQIGPDPMLLVLDDVWPGSESILHKLKFRIENYKILVTSRYEFPSFGSTYKLQQLNHADAVTLFQRLALPRDQQSYAPDQQTPEEVI